MIEQKLNEQLKKALKDKDSVKVGTIRLIINEIKTKKINEMIKDDISEEIFLKIVTKMAKQRKESIDSFAAAGRDDLVEKESGELVILEEYLPVPITKEELASIIDDVIASEGATSPKDIGRVMKAIIARTNGLADGKEISAIVKERLN